MTTDPLQKLVMVSVPDSAIAENFRSLRTNVARHLNNGVRKLLVGSSWAGEGKTLVVANLAVALAQIQKQVIIIDADLRRPKMTTLFGLVDQPGLCNSLADSSPAAPHIQRTGVASLRILPAGNLPDPNPTDLMSGLGMKHILAELEPMADVVLVDSSPLAIFSESSIIATMVDAVMLVINTRRWRGEEEVQVKRQLETLGANVIGMVLNELDQNERGPDEYKYRYRYQKNKAKAR
ncbi:MAG TPA: CpsD/CapB family tyrosine-protein kinase [Candidatus Xenobia bacterium]|jgi:capsular exopolysaccharide synthesis family protein